MKSINNLLLMLLFLLSTANSIAQSTVKPVIITKPDMGFLQKISKQATAFSTINFKGFTANDKSFVQLIQLAKGAEKWKKVEYISFKRKATSIIKAAGITGEPDDGGEVFGEPDDGGEVFASNKLLLKFLYAIQAKYKL